MIANLPIHAVLDELKAALDQRDEAVLQAPPGAGKTTIVPLEFLTANWLAGQTILLLEPRRIATRNAAERMAQLLGESVGDQVGYRMRLDSKVGSKTRIEVITEGILTRRLQDDPALVGVGLVIFDEFHERSLDADLGLALCLKSREVFRDSPLKILVMSATLEGERLSQLLSDAPIITSQGQSWPVDIIYGRAAQPKERIVDRMVSTIASALKANPDSSLLAFLPGEGEIRRVAVALQPLLDSHTILTPLYGNLPLEQQRQAVAPVSDPGLRKVVIATNIAETSITIEGVDVVVDSGLERQAIFDPNTAMTRLQTRKISQASAIQRAGRAGRLRPGKCYRLWSEEQQKGLAPYGMPEIASADLAPLAIQLLHWGLDHPSDLAWLDEPSPGAWQQALDLLNQLGATEQQGPTLLLSPHGNMMSRLSLPPRLSHMLINGQLINEATIACCLAALLSDRDPFSSRESSREQSGDIHNRLDILLKKSDCPQSKRGWLMRTLQLADRYRQQLRGLSITPATRLTEDDVAGFLVACAFPDRIGRKRHAGGYQLSNGRSASFATSDRLDKNRWLAIAEVGGIAGRKGDIIRIAAPFNPDLLNSALPLLTTESTQIEWDKKSGRFIAERLQNIGALVLKREAIPQLSEEAKSQAICSHLRREGLSLFKCWNNFQEWRARVQLVREYLHPEWPNLSDDKLLATLETWLGPYLGPINRLDELQKLDIKQMWLDHLGYERQQELKRLAPELMEVPSGSNIRINYREMPPVLAVKLQEMFGSDATPAILDGKVELLVHLLSPAGRPLQVTQDLAGFWRSSYKEVKKEMKGRYPKHPWPDDPTEAVATRHTKNRR
ncbi:MAG: ATP-dependent helicase HrpB [Candidatus Azotimanducaceae bacterium]|jgi:ATP-dependent helicase HrpB